MEIRDSVKKKLIQKIRGEVFFDELTRRIYAYSASICYLIPAAVIYPLNKEDVVNTVRIANEEGIPVTARGAGSGVAGQNLGEGIILDFSMHMKHILALDRINLSVVAEPGVIRSDLNKWLNPEEFFFPPDPSSSDYATVGGMAANNSGGAHSLLYGTTKNYIKSLTIITADGEEIFINKNGAAPLKYRSQVLDLLQGESLGITRHKPESFRNSCGYNLFESMQDDGQIDLTRIFCGSEGTLGIFTQIELDLLKIPKHRSSILLCYKDAITALSEVENFLDLSPSTVQALSEEFLRLISNEDPGKLSKLQKDTNFILLVEFDGDDPTEIKIRADKLIGRSSAFKVDFAKNSSELAWVWEIRRSAAAYLSLLPGDKPTRWIEDAAVPVEKLLDFVLDLEILLKKYNTSAALFGHAGQGLLHFSPRLNRLSPDFQKIIENLGHEHALLSRKFNGVPSGEHGDGLLRTPYLKEIWGEVYPYFEKIKKIFDPNFIMNPLCIVPIRDYEVSDFLRFYKNYSHKEVGALNQFISDIEACHGCGKCKNFCPVTRSQEGEIGSTRARVSLLREIIAGHLKEPFERTDLLEFFNLCLHCKTCQRECPTGLDMAQFIESFFEEKYLHKTASVSDKILSKSRLMGKIAVKTGELGKKAAQSPLIDWLGNLAGLANLKHIEFSPLRRKTLSVSSKPVQQSAVIFTGCTGDFFNASEIKAALAILEKFGFGADLITGYCCGEPAFVRGFKAEGEKTLRDSLNRLRNDIKLEKPVIFTSPSCLLPYIEHAHSLLSKSELRSVKKNFHESIAFILDQLLKVQKESASDTSTNAESRDLRQTAMRFFKSTDLKIAVQVPCHLKLIKKDSALIRFIEALPVAETKVLTTSCCGFGGSRGFEKKWAQHAERIGQALATEIQSFKPNVVVSPCVTCRIQIRNLLGEKIRASESEDLERLISGESMNTGKIQVVHPLVFAFEILK